MGDHLFLSSFIKYEYHVHLCNQAEVNTVPFFWTVQFGKSLRYAGHGHGWEDVIYQVSHGLSQRNSCSCSFRRRKGRCWHSTQKEKRLLLSSLSAGIHLQPGIRSCKAAMIWFSGFRFANLNHLYDCFVSRFANLRKAGGRLAKAEAAAWADDGS